MAAALRHCQHGLKRLAGTLDFGGYRRGGQRFADIALDRTECSVRVPGIRCRGDLVSGTTDEVPPQQHILFERFAADQEQTAGTAVAEADLGETGREIQEL